MSDTVTFSSGVYIGSDPGDGSQLGPGWFDDTPVVEFSQFTLEVSSIEVLTSVEGRPGDREPVLLRFEGSGMASAYNTLKLYDARRLLNGQPFATLSDFRDAEIHSGKLLRISLHLFGTVGALEEWGVLANVRNTVQGGQAGWMVTAVFHPCDLVNYTGTSSWVIRPGTDFGPDAGS
jgi:hypothetical protein